MAANVNLAGTLNVSFTNGFVSAYGDTFTIIRNDGSNAVSGTFDGLAQGAVLNVGGRELKINYAGGDGNDVTLTDVTLVNTTPVTTVNAVEGNSTGNVVLATFTSGNPAAQASDFTATINLGGAVDGTPTAAVQLVSTPVGNASGRS